MRQQRTIGLFGVGVAAIWLGGIALASADPQGGAAPVPTFAKDVAPILYKNCTSCHREGEIGPMPLVTYEDARPYASDIRDQVMAGHMPPWHADPTIGKFLNERRLSDKDKQTIARWVAAGAPRGNARDLPAPPKFPTGWTIGTPDVVLQMPTEYEVPAGGTIAYQLFTIPTNFTEDRWVQAIEVRPGARSVVHHVLVYARDPNATPRQPVLVPVPPPGAPDRSGGAGAAAAAATGAATTGGDRSGGAPPTANPPAGAAGARPPGQNRLGTLLATAAPGMSALTFRPGTALLIKAGSVLTFQMHYTANGTATKDRSSIGLIFAKEPPVDEIRPGSFVNTRLMIPAGASDHRVDAAVTVAEDIHVWGLLPHTHLRGKRWEYRVVYPDGRTERILSVPTYDFDWQTYYMFEKPLALPKGTRIESSAWYDNSAGNRSNPDSKIDVRWGEQTWEEMQYTGITFSVDSLRRTTATGGGIR